MKQLTKLEAIEERIIDKGILLYETSTSSVKTAAIKMDSKCAIFFDVHKFDSITEQVEALTHEYYHVDQDAFYKFDDSLRTVKRREFKANCALVKELVPINEFTMLLSQGYSVYDIAEELGVTVNLIELAYKIYKQKGMIE